ncbi:MAG: peptidoglycan-binding protein [Mesorhizobium sp.]|nr:peptidoglycan-binding protein [Mesorhizobium sp.]MCO5164649.1 peptidoglycan-binding protein [Mesorhizobium sp.]
MDKSVPAGAALLLDFIRETEVGTAARSGYDVIYGQNQSKLPKPVTKMTIAEIQAAQGGWSKRFKSSATGGYQFMKATLAGLVTELGLDTGMVFTPDLQDRLGYHLLKRRGYAEFMAGRISRTEFGKRLAQEWASFPVLAPCKGGKRQVKRGESFYAGDKLNKSLTSPERIEALLDRAKAASGKPTPPPMPVAPPELVSGPLKVDAILHRGSRGDFVAELQDNLNALGFGPINVDGDFGYATERAVKAFQTANGLKADGWAGPRTLEAIGKAIKDRETKPKLDAAAAVVDDAAGKGVSKTEVITTVTGIGGVATVVKETADSVRDGATSLMSLGPWILLAFVIAAGAGYVIWDRRRKRLAAKAVQEVL